MMYFDRKLTHWQFPVLFLDTRRKSLEGGRAVLAAAAQYGYEIKENYQILIHYQSIFYQGKLVFKDFIMTRALSLLIKRDILLYCAR